MPYFYFNSGLRGVDSIIDDKDLFNDFTVFHKDWMNKRKKTLGMG